MKIYLAEEPGADPKSKTARQRRGGRRFILIEEGLKFAAQDAKTGAAGIQPQRRKECRGRGHRVLDGFIAPGESESLGG